MFVQSLLGVLLIVLLIFAGVAVTANILFRGGT